MFDSDQALEESALGAALAPSPRVRDLLARLEPGDFVSIPRAVAGAVLTFDERIRYDVPRGGRDLRPLEERLGEQGVVHGAEWARRIESWQDDGAWITGADVDELLARAGRRASAARIAAAHAALEAGEPLEDIAGVLEEALAGLPRGRELVSQ